MRCSFLVNLKTICLVDEEEGSAVGGRTSQCIVAHFQLRSVERQLRLALVGDDTILSVDGDGGHIVHIEDGGVSLSEAKN